MSTLVHISDLHFGAEEPGLPEALRQAVAAEKADLLVASGDFSQHGTRRELREARAFLDSLPSPRLVVPGNHDIPHGLRLWARFAHPFADYRAEISPETEPVWQTEALLVAGVNSVRPGGWYLDWSRGDVALRQMARLARLFAAAPEGALRVMVAHHPTAAPPGGTHRHLLEHSRHFFRELGRLPVDLILSGHFHQSYVVPVRLPPSEGRPRRSVVLSVASTAISFRRQGEPNGYHVIEAAPDRIVVRARTWDGETFAPSRGWTFLRDAEGQWIEAGAE